MTIHFTQRLNAPSLEQVSQLRQQLQTRLAQNHCQPKQQNAILLAFSEAATNIVQHGTPSWLTIELSQDANNWQLSLSDDGKPWQVESAHSYDLLTEDFSAESGRGLWLIEQSCDRISHHRAEQTGLDHNCLQLFWHKPAAPKPRVLLVEDDPVQAKLLQAYLHHDYEVVRQTDGLAAKAYLEHNQVALVLSDINMPLLDGIGLRQQLAERADTATLPFVFFSADQHGERRAGSLAIDRFLTKPVNKTLLLNTLQQVLNRAEQLKLDYGEVINKQISAALKPSAIPEHHGWRYAIAYRDSGKGGGDLSFHRKTGDHLHLFIGDVMGHDQAAKFFSYALAGIIRSLLNQLPDSEALPAELLNALSESFCGDPLLSAHTSLTGTALCFNANRQLTIANAGHPPPLLITEQGIESLAISGIMPGLIPHPNYASLHVTLNAGQRVALYTDGLYESAPTEPAREQLKAAVLAAMQQSLPLPLTDALAHCMSVFDQFASGEIDDTLLVLLEHKGDPFTQA